MTTFKTFIAIVTLILCTNISWSQVKKTTLEEDPFFQTILNEKRKTNTLNTASDRFKIQIFYGNNTEAKRSLIEFKQKFNDIDGTIVYTNPLYKVWVGNFKTKLEAKRNLEKIKNYFPNSLIIEPEKRK